MFGGHCVVRSSLSPHETSAQKTFAMTWCDTLIMYIPVMPLALSCNCFIVASLRLVLVGWVSFLGDSCVFSYGCIYVSGRIQAFLFHLCICCIAPVAVRHIRFLLVRVLSGSPPCVGWFR